MYYTNYMFFIRVNTILYLPHQLTMYTNLSVVPILPPTVIVELYQKDHLCPHLFSGFQKLDKMVGPRINVDLIGNTFHHALPNCMLVLLFRLEHIVLIGHKTVLIGE